MKQPALDILVIDDNQSDYILIRGLLATIKGQKFNVDWASSFEDGLAEIKRKQHDLYLIDYILDRRDGLELLRRAAEIDCQGPFIFLTGETDRRVDLQAMEAGAADYLVKHRLDASLLERSIRYAIQHKRAELQLRESEKRLRLSNQRYRAAYDQAIVYAQELKNEIVERKRIEKVLKQRAIQLAIINDIGSKISAILDLGQMLKKAVSLVQEAFDYHHVALFLVEEDVARLKAIAGSYEAYFPPDHTQKLKDGIIGWVATHGEKVVANDVNHEPRYISLIADHTITQAELCLPIKIAAQILGVLNIQSPRLNAFSENDVVAMEMLMDQIAVALANSRLHAEMQRRTKEWAALNEATRAMTSSLDLEWVLDKTMVETNTLLGSERASVLLHDANTQELYFAAVASRDQDTLLGVTLPSNAGIAGWTLQKMQPVLANNVQNDPRFYDGIDATAGMTTRSILAVPMVYQDQVIGVVEVINKTNGDFDQHDLEILEVLTHSAAIAIENARLYNETNRRAKQLEVLHELDRAIITNLLITDVYRTFALHSARLLAYDYMSISFQEGEQIYIAFIKSQNKAILSAGAKLPFNTSAAGWAIKRGQPLLRHNITTEARFAEDQHLIAGGIQSLLLIPLRIKGQFTGAWNLGSHQIGAYHPDDLKIAQAMADQLAIAIQNAWLFEEVQTGREQLQRLNRRIVSAQEEERQRLSRELHDEAGQALTALKIGLELIQGDLPPGSNGLADSVSEAINLTEMTMEQLRALARDLRPPALDTAGLNPTLQGLCREFARRTQLPIDYTGAELATLSDTINICLYRFLQEALTNVAKHAQAGQVWVKLTHEHHAVCLTVEDNGQGFNQQVRMAANHSKGIGLVGMQERLELLNGHLKLESHPGQGTCLKAIIPIEGD